MFFKNIDQVLMIFSADSQTEDRRPSHQEMRRRKSITLLKKKISFDEQLAEVICEETLLRQENRRMSVIIAEAQTVRSGCGTVKGDLYNTFVTATLNNPSYLTEY